MLASLCHMNEEVGWRRIAAQSGTVTFYVRNEDNHVDQTTPS